MNVVARERTPISTADAVTAVQAAYEDVFDRAPTRVALALLLALVWTETAQGISVFNHNVGNITAREDAPGDAWRPPWFELDEHTSLNPRNVELHEKMERGEAPRAFRAYGTREEGASDFLRVLRSTFPEVLDAAELGDAERFRVALSHGYSSGYKDPKSTRTLENFQRDFSSVLGVSLPKDAAAVPSSGSASPQSPPAFSGAQRLEGRGHDFDDERPTPRDPPHRGPA